MARLNGTILGWILIVTILSALYAAFRAPALSTPEEIAPKGLAARRRELGIFYAMVPIVVGLIAFFVYRGMLARSPETAQGTFLLIAIGIGWSSRSLRRSSSRCESSST